jgi:hypothetical protein
LLPGFLENFLLALDQEVVVQKNVVQTRETVCLITQVQRNGCLVVSSQIVQRLRPCRHSPVRREEILLTGVDILHHYIQCGNQVNQVMGHFALLL